MDYEKVKKELETIVDSLCIRHQWLEDAHQEAWVAYLEGQDKVENKELAACDFMSYVRKEVKSWATEEAAFEDKLRGRDTLGIELENPDNNKRRKNGGKPNYKAVPSKQVEVKEI